jgi:hypothetical protein
MEADVMRNPIKSIKKRWTDYLERLAKVNEEMYGDKRLDCCDLNKNQQSRNIGGQN